MIKKNRQGKSYQVQSFDFSSKTRKELEDYIRVHGKRVNQRLSQLEKSGYDKASKMYQYNLNKAFDNTMGYYKQTANGNPRFILAVKGSKKNPISRNYLVSLATEIARSESAVSSTVSGIKQMQKQAFQKGAQTFNTSYGANISGKDFGEFMKAYSESGLTEIPYSEIVRSISTNDMRNLTKYLSESRFNEDMTLNGVLREFNEKYNGNNDLTTNE